MKRKRYKLILVLLICKMNLFSQTAGFRFEAALQPVDSSGFYNIVLTPELNAHLKTDYSDLRVLNDSGKWVPHLVTDPNQRIAKDAVVFDMKILSKENSQQNTVLNLSNTDSSISNIHLTVRNTVARRYCTLAGSDDGRSWFVINDSIDMNIERGDGDNGVIKLFFPPVNYRYFKVAVNNNGKEPLNILQAGTAGFINSPGKWFWHPLFENPSTKVIQKDSGKISYIRVEQAAEYHFGKLSLKLSGVKYYNRQAALYIPSSISHSFASPGVLAQSFTISNNSTLEFVVPVSNARVFYISIQNDDNLPLKIESVKTFTSYKTASVYLEKNKGYKLLLDNREATIPNYDLTIKDIPADNSIPLLAVSTPVAVQKPVVSAPQKNDSKKLVWLVIGIAVLVLGFFTYRLIKDLDKSKT